MALFSRLSKEIASFLTMTSLHITLKIKHLKKAFFCKKGIFAKMSQRICNPLLL